ncbi:hypothetical protein PInf_002730 [Phytophthora infestans]|nr:hypothetical protein PInf_002730 [Phytophthora infestans]
MINALLEDLDQVLGYCSRDMAGGLWAVQKIEHSALNGYLRITKGDGQTRLTDVFQEGESDVDSGLPVMGRMSQM